MTSTIQNFHLIAPVNFPARLRALMGRLEGNNPLPYFDTAGVITIGIGFNINGRGANRDLVMGATGMGLSIAQQATINAAFESARMAEIRAMPQEASGVGPLIDAKNQALRTYLNEVLAVRSFDMTQPQIDAVFLQISQTHLTAISPLISIPSLERLALVSLHFNSPGLVGPRLRAALALANPYDARAEAWFEIRYSHADQLHKRRYIEAALFGLYGNGVPAADAVAQAEGIYRMYARHGRAETMRGSNIDMLVYETTFTAQRGQAQLDLNAAGFGTVQVQALREELRSAANTLIKRYITDGGITGVSAIDPLNVQVAYNASGVRGEDTTTRTGSNHDLLIGRDGPSDVLSGLGGNDVLVGLGGADTLIGGAGDDVMVGGAGLDTYIVEGNDRIIDTGGIVKDKNGRVIAGAFVDRGDGVFERVQDPTTTGTQNSPFTIHLADGSSAVFDAFRSGDFGIRLITDATPVNPATTLDIFGDREPEDVDPAPGLQTGTDEWGNLRVTGVVEADRADTLFDTPEADHIIAGGGNDTIIASRGGADLIEAGAGNDWLEGDSDTIAFELHGNDYLDGGDGDDTLIGQGGSDILFGGAGNDTIFGDQNLIPATLGWQLEITPPDYTYAGIPANAAYTGRRILPLHAIGPADSCKGRLLCN